MSDGIDTDALRREIRRRASRTSAKSITSTLEGLESNQIASMVLAVNDGREGNRQLRRLILAEAARRLTETEDID